MLPKLAVAPEAAQSLEAEDPGDLDPVDVAPGLGRGVDDPVRVPVDESIENIRHRSLPPLMRIQKPAKPSEQHVDLTNLRTL